MKEHLGFEEELRLSLPANIVIGASARLPPLDADLAFAVGQALGIAHVPTQRFEEWVDKVETHLRFGVIGAHIVFAMPGEFLDEDRERLFELVARGKVFGHDTFDLWNIS